MTLLGLHSSSTPEKLSNETLSDASNVEKKALDIYDELMNGSKFLREVERVADNNGGGEDRTGSGMTGEDGPTTSREWEDILRDQTSDVTSPAPTEVPLSSIWLAYHKCESARALGLVARCYALAGSAVTAEGLFQSAMDASSSHPFGRRIRHGDTVTDDSIRNNNNEEQSVLGMEASIWLFSPSSFK